MGHLRPSRVGEILAFSHRPSCCCSSSHRGSFFLTKQELRLPCQECLKATNVCIAMLPQQFFNDKVEQHPNLVGEHKFVYLFQSNNPRSGGESSRGEQKRIGQKGAGRRAMCVHKTKFAISFNEIQAPHHLKIQSTASV